MGPLITANLNKAILRQAVLAGSNLEEVNLEGADLQGAAFNRANLKGANLKEADLQGAALSEANLEGANLQGANLREAILMWTNLEGANLREANLREMHCAHVNLKQQNLDGADLYETFLPWANLQEASLVGVLWDKGDMDQAANTYRRALEADPSNENITWNYTRFLRTAFDDWQATREVLDRGITTNPESGRLLLLRADLSLHDGNASEALEGFRRAREKGADPAAVEAGCAFALQLGGAPIGECIAAYRAAIALNADDGALRLNLAQLLFVRGDDREANRLLLQAMRLGLDESAQLEAQFYLLCHTSSELAEIVRVTKRLLTQGARLRWNVSPNIETVSRRDPQKAVLLELVSEVMAGDQDQMLLDRVLARWP